VASKSHRRPNPWGELRPSSERLDHGGSWLGLPAEQDGAAPQGEHNIPKPVRRTGGLVNAAVVQREIMSLPGGEKHRFEREGGEPKAGFFVEQGGATKKAACLSAVMGVVEQSPRGCALTGQQSAEDENPGVIPGKGPKAV